MSGQHFKYPECTKGANHVGEILNLVCVQPDCIQKSVICGMCYDEAHRNHMIRPLKVVINDSLKYLEGLTPLSLDVQKLRGFVLQSKNKLLASFGDFEKYIKDSMDSIKSKIEAIFIIIWQQIQLKTGTKDELVKALQDIKTKQMQYEPFVILMQKLLAGVPLDPKEEDHQISGSEIQQEILGLKIKLENNLQVKQTKIRTQIQSFTKLLEKTIQNPNIFDSNIEFQFSSQLKHKAVTVVSDTIIKSTEGYNYHFGLLEPSLQEKGNKSCRVCFKVNESHNNWVALGVCHKNIIINNNYSFNSSTLGHGAYLISSNGGSFSSIDANKNGIVNAFSFKVGDIVVVEYDSTNNKVVFTKKGTAQSHILQLQTKNDDELYLCGLFYFSNDEIQFLGYDQ